MKQEVDCCVTSWWRASAGAFRGQQGEDDLCQQTLISSGKLLLSGRGTRVFAGGVGEENAGKIPHSSEQRGRLQVV